MRKVNKKFDFQNFIKFLDNIILSCDVNYYAEPVVRWHFCFETERTNVLNIYFLKKYWVRCTQSRLLYIICTYTMDHCQLHTKERLKVLIDRKYVGLI